MSLEAIQKVAQAEEQARTMKANAVEQGKTLVADAQKAGKEQLEQVHTQSDVSLKALVAQAESRATATTQTAVEQAKNACDTLRSNAQSKLPEASALIIRKVVGV